jgi:Uncharacterized membrane-associated protein
VGLLTWAGIFVTMILENFGVPFPTEASYILAAELVKRGASYALLLSLLTGGHLTGCMLAYGLGRWGEERLTRRWRDNPKFMKVSESIHGWYARYGNITIFATRFVGYVRPWSSIVAGFAGIRWQPFLYWTFIGTLLFNIGMLEFTIYLLDWWHRFGFLFRCIAVILFLLSFSVIFLIKHYYWRPEPEER